MCRYYELCNISYIFSAVCDLIREFLFYSSIISSALLLNLEFLSGLCYYSIRAIIRESIVCFWMHSRHGWAVQGRRHLWLLLLTSWGHADTASWLVCASLLSHSLLICFSMSHTPLSLSLCVSFFGNTLNKLLCHSLSLYLFLSFSLPLDCKQAENFT